EAVASGEGLDLAELGLGEPDRRQGGAAEALGGQARAPAAAPRRKRRTGRAGRGSGWIARSVRHDSGVPRPRAPARRPPRAGARGTAEANEVSRVFREAENQLAVDPLAQLSLATYPC